MSAEEWRPVVGYEGLYEVSSLGRVKSVGRGRGRVPGRIVRMHPLSNGFYLKVDLHRDGVRRSKPVHRLVGDAFLGPLPEGLQTRHLNGDGFDNRVTNLKYGTHLENMQDAVRHGTHISLRMKARTHCTHGHEFTEANTWHKANGSRVCRRCSIDQTMAAQRRTLTRREAAGEVTPHVIRLWAKEQGFEVAAEGRLSNELKRAFSAAHGSWVPAPSTYRRAA